MRVGPRIIARRYIYAVRRQAAADGRLIDPWHLAAVIEGMRFRMDAAITIIDRGALFEAARHAFVLWSWFTRPDAGQAQAIEQATGVLAASQMASPLLGAAKPSGEGQGPQRAMHPPRRTMPPAAMCSRRCASRWC